MNEDSRVPTALCFVTQLLEHLATKAISVCTCSKGSRVCKYRALLLLGLNFTPIASLFATLALAVSASAATLYTDHPDYSPGQHVIFTGAGWQPGETVTISVEETSVDPIFLEGTVSAIAAADGTISNGQFQVQQSFLGQGFLASAVGQTSGLTASTTFLDSAPIGVAPVSPP